MLSQVVRDRTCAASWNCVSTGILETKWKAILAQVAQEHRQYLVCLAHPWFNSYYQFFGTAGFFVHVRWISKHAGVMNTTFGLVAPLPMVHLGTLSAGVALSLMRIVA